MNAPPPPVAHSRWGAALIVVLGTIAATLDSTIVNVALPAVAEDLNITVNQVAWVPLAYTMTLAALVLPCGRLADRAGYRGLYMYGFAAFTLGSVLCALSSSLGLLIISRVVQAAGGAGMLACGTAVLVLSFPAHQRGRALGLVPVAVAVGISAGPVLGGFLTQHLHWSSIFWVNVPLCLPCIWLAGRILRPGGGAPGSSSLDWAGLVTLTGLTVAFVWGTNLALEPGHGWGDGQVLALLSTAVVLLAVLLHLQRRHPNPLLPLGLLREGVFSASLMAGALSMLLVFATTYILNYQLQKMQGLDRQLTGLVLLTSPVCLSILGPLSGWVSDRFGSSLIRLAGVTLATLGVWLMSSLEAGDGASQVVWRLALFGVGMGCFQTPNNHVTMSAAPAARMGVASGFVACMRIYGMLLGTVLSTVLLGQLLRRHLGDDPPDVASLEPVTGAVQAFQDTFRCIALVGFLIAACVVASLYARRRVSPPA